MCVGCNGVVAVGIGDVPVGERTFVLVGEDTGTCVVAPVPVGTNAIPLGVVVSPVVNAGVRLLLALPR